jgi:hypothetical protein
MRGGIALTGLAITWAGFCSFLWPWSQGHLPYSLFYDVFILGAGSLPYGMTFSAVAFVTGIIIMLLADISAALRGQKAVM